jgi:hypothetical protein
MIRAAAKGSPPTLAVLANRARRAGFHRCKGDARRGLGIVARRSSRRALSLPVSCCRELDAAAAAARTHKSGISAPLALGCRGGVRLDLTLTIEAPHAQPDPSLAGDEARRRAETPTASPMNAYRGPPMTTAIRPPPRPKPDLDRAHPGTSRFDPYEPFATTLGEKRATRKQPFALRRLDCAAPSSLLLAGDGHLTASSERSRGRSFRASGAMPHDPL